MYLGVDYYPEQWPENFIDKDLKRMVNMGVNTIRIGEFAWSKMEPQPGEFTFSFFDRVIKKAKKEGISVIFGTPTATVPIWLVTDFPDSFSVDENGMRHSFGGRRQACYNSADYRKQAKNLVKNLVKHYSKESSVIGWQIDNELGHEGSDQCYCDHCKKSFRKYLKKKYKKIERLNRAWGTEFWGQTYYDFNHIPIPTKTITTHNPSLRLDWARFWSWSLNDFAKEQIDVVRKHKGRHQKITTNFTGDFFNKWFDHNTLAESLDFVSYDNYPVWGGLLHPLEPCEIAMKLDFYRGLKQKPFWIMEQIIGSQGHDVLGYTPRPGQAKLWAFQAMARGAEGLLFFRWRTATHGSESFCHGILEPDNEVGRKYKEAKEAFEEIKNSKGRLSGKMESHVLIIYNWDSLWSWKNQPQSLCFDYKTEFMRLYRPFFEKNMGIDCLPSNCDYTKYKIVLVPCQQILEPEQEKKLKDFVEQGGTLIVSFRTAIRNQDNASILGEMLPVGLSELLGIHIEGGEPILNPLFIKGLSGTCLENQEGTAQVWRDSIVLKKAKSVAIYSKSDQLFQTAISKNEWGKGAAYYVGAGVSNNLLNVLVTFICEKQEMKLIQSPAHVEVIQKIEDDKKWNVVLNHSADTVLFEEQDISPYGMIFKSAIGSD